MCNFIVHGLVKLNWLIYITIREIANNVKVSNEKHQRILFFILRAGFRQGDSLSTLSFTIVIEKVIRNSRLNTEGNKAQMMVFHYILWIQPLLMIPALSARGVKYCLGICTCHIIQHTIKPCQEYKKGEFNFSF